MTAAPPEEGEREIYVTPRLRVRHLSVADLDAMHAVYGDVDAMRWVADGHRLDRDGCRRWIDRTLDNYRRRGYGMAALVLRETGSVVGFCGLVHAEDQSLPELKYALRRESWGQGLACEAARGMIAYGARRFAHREIIATTDPANLASHRVLLKAGMRDAGTRRNDDGSLTRLFVWRAADERPS
jgi:RimJ/RimL family protein N-acetyltransferase